MSAINQTYDIPAVLPVGETDDERQRLLRQAAEETPVNELSNELDDEEALDEVIKPARISKKKLFFAFTCCIAGFALLLALLSWFFGIGVFAQNQKRTVDRTPKGASVNSAAPVTEEEKLKMALNLIAEKNPASSANQPGVTAEMPAANNTNLPIGAPTPSAELKTANLNEPVVIPDNPPDANRSAASTTSPAQPAPDKPKKPAGSGPLTETENPASTSRSVPPNVLPNRSGDTITAPGRSLFFGTNGKAAPEKFATVNFTPPGNSKNEPVAVTNKLIISGIPFGTLLPVRLLGAVYTLRASGGPVRMELTRAVTGKNFSYPAGTILVGSVRGSEYKRAFMSVTGLIDPATGGLVKFTGEVMGNDGASGISGRLRQVKGAWSRVFQGMRDAGGLAIGALGANRSGGTLVISDSAMRASGDVTEQLSGIVGNKAQNEFVEITAGATGFVLVTDLPGEALPENVGSDSPKSATGLSEEALADLFSSNSPEKIRAALPMMTPAFRALAEKALISMDGQ